MLACSPSPLPAAAYSQVQRLPPSHPAALLGASRARGPPPPAARTLPCEGAAAGSTGAAQPAWRARERNGRGLFARCTIPCGAWLGDYTGVVKLQQPRDTSRYLLELRVPSADGEPQLLLDIDAEHWGNEARFINDFSGLAAAPNVAFIPYRKARPSVRTTPPLHRAPAASHTTHRALRGAAGAHGRACDRRDRPALDPARGGNSRLLRGQRVACSRRAIVYAVAKVC